MMAMKKHKITIALAGASMMLASCNFLDFDETNELYTHDDIYTYFDTTKQMLTNVYSYIPQDFGTIDGAMRDCASDDAEFGNTGGNVQNFNNGNWSAVNDYDSAWSLYYGIRAANEFIGSIAKTDFSRYENDTNYANWMRQIQYFSYEARVLRAFFAFELAKRYGDIALPLKMLSTEEANSIGKTSFNDVVEFIVSECEQCAKNLPATYIGEPNNETGRITKGFAMALKSKSLLYAASLLHNPTMDIERWKRSAKAALEIIETGYYSLDPNDKSNNIASPELVLARMNESSGTFELNNFPIRFTEGKRETAASATFPTQNLVDAFQTINGYPVTLGSDGWICNDPQFDPQNPYNNRDVRFARTVLYNNCRFKNVAIETFIGGNDDVAVSAGGSPTGYFLKKHIIENTSFVPNQIVTNYHHWIVYRYAETLLTYAESMIEAFGDPSYTDETYKYSASWALNLVRTNAGMPNVTTVDKSSFTVALRNEWRVEFAFEDHRFWDIRRWKIGNATQCDIYGVTIDVINRAYTFNRKRCETRKWKECYYLYPIPQSELFKNPNLAPQNTGW